MSDRLKNEIYRITCLVSEIDATYHRASVKLGLSDSEVFILYMLYINGYSCPLNDIYTMSGISKQTVSSSIRRLESKGVITLESLDGRSKTVTCTREGRDYVAKTGKKLYLAEESTFCEWTEDEIANFADTLERYNCLLRERIEKME